MSWTIKGIQVTTDSFGNLAPIETLYDYDGPQIYTARDQGRLLFVYVSDAGDQSNVRRLLLVPTEDNILNDLKSGKLSLLGLLEHPWLHAADQDLDNFIAGIWHLPDGIASVPDGFKPEIGTLLSINFTDPTAAGTR